MKHSSSDFLIRESTSADEKEVAEVFASAFAPVRMIYRPTLETLSHQTKHPWEETRLVAVINEQIVATVQFDLHEEHLHVIGLAVRPEFQRKGIAGHLLNRICDHSASTGRHKVVIETIKETGNVPLFEKLGFQIVNEVIANWCISEIHDQLHFVTMERTVVV